MCCFLERADIVRSSAYDAGCHSRLGVSVLLCHTKINYVNEIGVLGIRSSNQEVVGFDITVD